MSLVDYYASSSDDDEDTQIKDESKVPKHDHAVNIAPIPQPNQQSVVLPNGRTENVSRSTAPLSLKLPDASFLLNTPTLPSHMGSGNDHSSSVAAAIAESASRKRESNRRDSSLPRDKVPRGTLRHTKNIPDTVGGLLVPPQISGRSNVVTEDVGKLFVRRRSDPSPRPNAN